jgi:hypothetical protein
MTARPDSSVTDESPDATLPYERWLVLAVLILSVALRLHHVGKPLSDHHSWRQTQTAMIAANLYRDGFNLWSPRVDFYCTEVCSESGLLVLEFPLYNALVAVLYKVFGLREFAGRLVSIIFSTLAALLLYRLAKRILGPDAALVAAAFFVVSPISVFYGRAFMPESLMLCAGIGALLYFHDWLQDERWSTFGVAVTCALIAFLVKPPMIHIGIPMTYMAWAKHGRALFRKKAPALFLMLCLVPSTIWLYHSATSPNLDMGWLLSDINLLRDKNLYRIMWERLGREVLTSVGRALFIFGLLVGLRRAQERVLDVWLGATVLYVLAFGTGNIVHDYYQLPLVPIASIYIGKAIAYLPQLPLRRFIWLPLTALLIVAAGAESWRIAKPWYGEDIPGLYQFAETVKRTVPEGPPIMVSSSYVSFAPWDPRLLYAFDRKGWNVPPQYLKRALGQAASRGVAHLVIYPTEGLDPALLAHLVASYHTAAMQKTATTGMVFDLGAARAAAER